MDSDLNSFTHFLIKRSLIDNETESETLTKFLSIFRGFSGERALSAEDTFNGGPSEPMPFETMAIFTLADFLKQLQANEYYDIAQKYYTEWLEESLGSKRKLQRLVAIMEKCARGNRTRAFFHWRSTACQAHLMSENAWLKERIDGLMHENNLLRSERHVLEYQAKKRSTVNINRIQPLRSNSRSRKASISLSKSSHGSNRK